VGASRAGASRAGASRAATPRRRGVALVTTLALLALAGVLLAGAFASAAASARATRSSRAGLVADAAARRALATALMRWSGAEESLLVGGAVMRVQRDSASTPLDSAESRVVVQRLTASLHVIAADVTVPATGAPLARRRMRVLVRKRTPVDTTVVQPPQTLSRWSVGALY
jgi:type II secretory pathway component PulK